MRTQRCGQGVAQAHVLFDGRHALVHDVLPRPGHMRDHGCDDGQDVFILFQRHGIREDPVHGKGAQDLVLEFDGHTDEGDGIFLQVTGAGAVQKDGTDRDIGHDHGLAALDDAPRDALAQGIVAPPLFGWIQTVRHLDAYLAGMGGHEGDHAPHHVQMFRHQGERRLQAVADVPGMVDDLGKIEQQTQTAVRFAHALPVRRRHGRSTRNSPFPVGGRQDPSAASHGVVSWANPSLSGCLRACWPFSTVLWGRHPAPQAGERHRCLPGPRPPATRRGPAGHAQRSPLSRGRRGSTDRSRRMPAMPKIRNRSNAKSGRP